MPRHATHQSSGELPRPVGDNTPAAAHRVQKKEKGKALPNEGKPSKSPQATSMPGTMTIIRDVGQRSGGIHGIPGIISSTLTSPETRQRLVSGILDPMSGSAAPQGPVHTVMGHDSTAYNAGSVHIRGSHFK
jgi:hypothetical protein